jgi:hypothetical protein
MFFRYFNLFYFFSLGVNKISDVSQLVAAMATNTALKMMGCVSLSFTRAIMLTSGVNLQPQWQPAGRRSKAGCFQTHMPQ